MCRGVGCEQSVQRCGQSTQNLPAPASPAGELVHVNPSFVMIPKA